MQNASEVQMQSCKESADAKRKDKAAKAKAAKGKAAKRAAGAKLQRQSFKESCKRQSCKGRSGKGKEAQRESCKRLVIPRILHHEGGISRLQSSHNRGIHLWLHRSSGHLLCGGLVRRARGGCGVDTYDFATQDLRVCSQLGAGLPRAQIDQLTAPPAERRNQDLAKLSGPHSRTARNSEGSDTLL